MKLEKLEKLKEGTLLKISDSYLKFWNKEAYSLCSNSGGSCFDAMGFFMRKALGLGFPYKCKFVSFTPNEPGARVEIFIDAKNSFRTILNYRDVQLLNGGKNAS